MTWISELPLRLLAKAICLPSGDQLGLLSSATSLVSRLTFLPSASARYSSWLPSRVLTHTSDLPSGAQRGDSSNALCGRRFLLSEPSALTVLICSLQSVPWRMSKTKTSDLLSGCQWASKCGVVCGSSALRSEPSAFIVQTPILPSWMRVSERRLPSGDQCRCCLKPPSVVRRTGPG